MEEYLCFELCYHFQGNPRQPNPCPCILYEGSSYSKFEDYFTNKTRDPEKLNDKYISARNIFGIDVSQISI
jgi:hypothetical protein